MAASDVERQVEREARALEFPEIFAGAGLLLPAAPTSRRWTAFHTRLALLEPSLPPEAHIDSSIAWQVLLGCQLLPNDSVPGVATSVRIPTSVHDAARAAVDARWAASFTELIVEGLRGRLAGLASTALDEESLREAREALEEHYGEHPEARPSLALVVESAAQLEDHPAAARPDLIEAAVLDLGEDAFVEDVLAWVRGALATETQVVPTKARRVVLR